MQCYTPMVRYYCIPTEEEKKNPDFKVWQKIIPRSEVFNNLQQDHNYLRHIQNKNEELEKSGSRYRYQLIPCRHCWACQLKYSAEWASRLMFESKYHEHKYFITLTYDEEHVPLYKTFKYIDEDNHVTIYENDGTWSGTLEPEDVTKFLKKMREYFREKGITGIKYFYCGEYGTDGTKHKTLGYRPHYHMILFGAPLDINQFYDWYVDNKHKKFHWKSKELDKWWEKGMIDVAEVEWNCCAYVARYCMKKLNTENDTQVYAEKGKIKEFVRMSRRPGIGMRYYQENKEKMYELDEVVQRTIKGNISSFKPPFDKKLQQDDPELYEKVKECRRAAAERNRKLKEELNKGISDLELMEREAEKTQIKGQMLKRVVDYD